MRILALADDLTGALEAGAKFAGHGIPAVVAIEPSLDPAGMSEAVEVLVVDTETRHLAPAQAAEVVGWLASEARLRGARLVYKKTDSTLRGNIGAELGAVLAAYAGAPLFYVPAYPEMGRTVCDGRLYVNGVPVEETAFARDALNPIRAGYIPDVLAAQCDAPARVVRPELPGAPAGPGIYVCDGETGADIEAAARAIMEMGGDTLVAGPAAVAEEIARLLAPLPPLCPAWPVIRSCLVINGSRQETSAAQVRHAESCGWPATAPGECVAAPGWRVLRWDCGPAQLGSLVRDILRETGLEALAVFGGDTAHAIVTALGQALLYPLGEVVPGVPLSKFHWNRRDRYLITKAGGFGPVDVLSRLRAALENEP